MGTEAAAADRVFASIRVNGDLRSTASDPSGRAIFPIYSVTKTLTAICVLRLVENGSLRLAETAREWLAELRLPDTMTLAHVLRHTGGLRDYGALPEYHEAVRAHPHRPWSRDQFLDAVLSRGLLFTPGERFSYSNVGYMLLADIIERVTGASFADAVDRFVVRPLALHDTFVLQNSGDLARCAPGYGAEVSADGTAIDVRGRYHPGWCAPRVVASTTDDVTRVFDALLAGVLLQPHALAEMLTLVPLSLADDETIFGGLGVYSDRASRWGRNYHHGGGGPGYSVSATVYPDTPLGRVAAAVCVNASGGPDARDCEAALLARFLDRAV